MRSLKAYLDASVYGGCFDEEFREDTDLLIEAIKSGRLMAVVSDLVVSELLPAPEAVRDVLSSLSENLVDVVVSAEAYALRDAYLAAGIVGPRWAVDALHVACATVERVDAIISWNFRHIVRLDRIKAYNAVNFAEGYGILTILSPKDVSFDEDEDEERV